MRNELLRKEAQSFFGPLKYMISFMFLAVVLLALSRPATVLATSVIGSVVNVSVNYIDETATVSSNAGSTKFYISIDKQKTWEDVPIIGGVGIVDISGLLSTKEVTIHFKGDKDGVNPFKLLAEPNMVTAAYVIRNGAGYIDYKTTGLPVEYRKGPNGNWKTPPVSFPTAIYEIKGATLQFRSAAVAGMRAGKIITVKIPKRPTPPSVKVDGSKLLISGIKANVTQYYDPAKPEYGWQYITKDSKVKTISLYDLAKRNSTAYGEALPASFYEFRNSASDKKAASGVKLIEVPAQPIHPTSIKLEGSTLTITDDAKRAYEYCKLTNGTSYNAATMKWTSIQVNKPTIIPKANVSDAIFVRLKSTVDKQTKIVIPASTCVYLPVNSITTK